MNSHILNNILSFLTAGIIIIAMLIFIVLLNRKIKEGKRRKALAYRLR